MARKPWWEWDAAELKHSTKFPAGYSSDYYEKPHGKDVWRKYLIDGEPVIYSVSEISGAIDDGKASGMAYKAAELTIDGIAALPPNVIDARDPELWKSELKKRKLTYDDVWGAKRDLGTTIHSALEVLCAGDVPKLSDFPEDEQPYIKAICGWFVDNDPTVLHTEMLVASREHRFAGRFDLLYEQNGQRVLADLKTSARIYPGYLIQLAGYALALEECGYEPVDRMEVIWAKPDGNFKVVPSRATAQDFINHIAALSSFNSNKNHLEEAA